MNGLFITFEGGDGSGKSTQSRLLAEWLEGRGREVVATREPGGTDLGREIRQLVMHGKDHVDERAEALLYAADRAHHVATVVRPALERGAVVLQDRYFDSSVAYQGVGRSLAADEVREVSMWAVRGLVPHATVLLDLDPEVGMQRLSGRGALDRLEAAGAEFHRRVRDAYLGLAEQEPQRFLVVDAAGDVDEIQAAIRARVVALLGAS
ncbi:dTMP kinase [uncultured Agrococcus sp.]|uniref:dTMP kinase n=1 Tax=uncultured Agrococcus sp. TaxID=382258 RepID=UPI0025F30297|nr:dTMP kinase [uncultured Agrococcus sp.]